MKIVRLKRDTRLYFDMEVREGQPSGCYMKPSRQSLMQQKGAGYILPDDWVIIHLPMLFDDMEKELWQMAESRGYTQDHDALIEEVLLTIDHAFLHQAIHLCQPEIPNRAEEEMLFRLGYSSPLYWILASDEERRRLAKIREARDLAEYHVRD